MSNEEKSIASENKPKSNSESIANWINGLNLAGFILLLCSFILTFSNIATPIPAMISIISACGLFLASAFVKLFKTTDWINYCRANKTETKFFDWLSLISVASFVALFLLSGGFGLFVNHFGMHTGVIDAMTTRVATGLFAFFAAATIALFYSVIVRLAMAVGYFKFTKVGLEDKLEYIANRVNYKLKSNEDDETLEGKFDIFEAQQNVSNFDKKHDIIKDHEFESEDDAADFFASVAVYYIRHNQFPLSVRISQSEKTFVTQIAARVANIQEAERKVVIELNSNKINMLQCDANQVVNMAKSISDREPNFQVSLPIVIPKPTTTTNGDLYNQFSSKDVADQFFAAIALHYIRNRKQFPGNIQLHDHEKDYIISKIVPKVNELRLNALSASTSVLSTSGASLSSFGFSEDTTAIDQSHVTASLMSSTSSSASRQLSSRSDGDEGSDDDDEKTRLVHHQHRS